VRSFVAASLVALPLLGCKKPPPLNAEGCPAEGGAQAASSVSASATGPCGEMPCTLFDTPGAAFDAVLAMKPVVLAIGETHAPRDASVASTTKRFTETMLPRLQGRATDLVLELWVANGKCGQQEKQVQKQQKDVTATQAETNQNDFVALGDAAKKLSIQPHVLVPACDEYARIVDAGAGDVDAMLGMIARLTARDLSALLAKRRDDASMLVAYGGAMHNDLAPRKGREAWSFGPTIDAQTKGRYVELDLIVPEFVKDTDAWRAQPWYAHWDRERHAKSAVLFEMGPRSYALVFPRTRP
jgi:hypothetical protein